MLFPATAIDGVEQIMYGLGGGGGVDTTNCVWGSEVTNDELFRGGCLLNNYV